MRTRTRGTVRVWIAGAATAGLGVVALAAAGGLDATFGTGGIVQTSLTDQSPVSDVAVQGDSKVVVCGRDRASASAYGWRFRRYTAAGALDSGFGSGGSVALFGATLSDTVGDMDLDASGRIVAGGAAGVATTSKGKTTYEVRAALVRLTTAGALDPSFGSGGVASLAIAGATGPEIRAVEHLADGRIVVAGTVRYETRSKGSTVIDAALFVARFTAAGALDTTFGSGGVTVNNIGAPGESVIALDSIGVQPDGKIVVGSTQNAADGMGNQWSWTLTRYHANGGIDTAFGNVRAPGDILRKVVTDASGNIVAIGNRGSGSSYDAVVARYTAAGALDTGFGSGGVRVIHLDAADAAYSGAIDANGKIALAVITGQTSSYDATVMRLNADGSDDATFGTYGVGTRIDLTAQDTAQALDIDPATGRIVIAGDTYPYAWFVARYDAN